ncbi:MAG: hypothetical protein EKK63_04995 [Acinetobacter sp.]|uniref:hypothetical protein n=1 Tax=Acinetobacter sp. TaxID=472 RepID=UPI000F949530|nr:hypothetical protein [Acinetobacter sp.]RUP41614.1 MAG: hypothetical protein EKK63_04995 [Acinetobacter sp.]
MSSLLSDNDFDEIRSAIKDVTDTFMQKPIMYHLDSNTATRMMKDINSERSYTVLNLLGLVVWENNNKDGKNDQNRTGDVDLTIGYVLINFEDGEAAGILNNLDELLITPPQDKISFDGSEYKIIGVNVIGQLKSKECLVKFHIKKKIRNENG